MYSRLRTAAAVAIAITAIMSAFPPPSVAAGAGQPTSIEILVASDARVAEIEEAPMPLGRATSDAQPHYGSCVVSIPPLHRMGMLESPYFSWLSDASRHVVLQGIRNLSSSDWSTLLTEQMVDARLGRALLLFHGHSVSKDEACKRAAQIKNDLGYDGPVVLFYWTVGFNHEYLKSREGIGWSAGFVRSLMKHLCHGWRLVRLTFLRTAQAPPCS